MKHRVTFVLDETGSMGAVKQQTINGFNEYIQTLAEGKAAKKTRVTLVKFNSCETVVVCSGEKLKNVVPLTTESYQPKCSTPLYDAIGKAVRDMEDRLGKKDTALVVIQTDGEENSSSEYSKEAITQLIKEKTAAGWTFVYLGADQDAWAAAGSIGLKKNNVMSYDSSQTQSAFMTTAKATSKHLSMGGGSTGDFYGK